jgi:hypothetical protein
MEAALDVVERLRQAVCDHNLDALGECFARDYRNETPAHPARGFVGRDQVRANWQRIFTGLPDVAARVTRHATRRDEVWTEWELAGTRPDGEAQVLRGVVIFGLQGAQFSWARFYLEPVDHGAAGVDAAVARIVEPR